MLIWYEIHFMLVSTKIQYRKYISSHPFLVFKEGLQGVKNSMRGIVKVRVVFKQVPIGNLEKILLEVSHMYLLTPFLS